MVYIGVTNQTNWPAELSSVALNVNGEYIDQVIDGFRTLKVAGRETLGNELELADVQSGAMLINKRLPSRELTVTYNLKADDGAELEEKFKELRKKLVGELEIQVNDEPSAYYYGHLAGMEVVPDYTHDVVSTFTILCPSPFKYGREVRTSGQATIDTFYPTLPVRIEVVVNQTTNKLEVTDGNYTISATGTFNAGTRAVFEFNPEEMTLTVDGVDSTYMIDLNSDFENFQLTNGSTLTSPHGSVTLIARERWL